MTAAEIEPTPIHDALALETFREQLARWGSDEGAAS